MWSFEHDRTTPVSPEALWKVLSDVDDWASWDTSIESAELRGAFRAGSEVLMTPTGQEAITSTITELIDHQLYADETAMGGVTLRFSHALTQLDGGGTRIVHRLEITGPTAEEVGPQLGPAITADFPEAMAALIARAGG